MSERTSPSEGRELTDLPVTGVRLLVVVGTDHHKFDRVVRWVDAWTTRQDRSRVDWVQVQYGHSEPPTVAEGDRLIPHAKLQQLMDDATVIVTHGGPASIVEARRHGLRPIVVPRDPALGEHVDGHQQRFARRMGAQGVVVLCETQAAFDAALDEAVQRPASVRLGQGESGAAGDPAVAAAVVRVGSIVDGLVSERAPRRA